MFSDTQSISKYSNVVDSYPISTRDMAPTNAVAISDEQHEDLLRAATHIEPREGEREPEFGTQVITQTVRRKVHVPIEQEVRVPITSKKVESTMETTVVRGTRMVPKKKYREVVETVLETKEEVVNGFRERWVKIKEPTSDIVKKQVPVDRTRKVSYIDYDEEVVEKAVEVPKDVVREVEGVRVDKHIGTKVVEIEEDVYYEVRPIYLQNGERRMRDTGDVQVHGKLVHGPEINQEEQEYYINYSTRQGISQEADQYGADRYAYSKATQRSASTGGDAKLRAIDMYSNRSGHYGTDATMRSSPVDLFSPRAAVSSGSQYNTQHVKTERANFAMPRVVDNTALKLGGVTRSDYTAPTHVSTAGLHLSPRAMNYDQKLYTTAPTTSVFEQRSGGETPWRSLGTSVHRPAVGGTQWTSSNVRPFYAPQPRYVRAARPSSTGAVSRTHF